MCKAADDHQLRAAGGSGHSPMGGQVVGSRESLRKQVASLSEQVAALTTRQVGSKSAPPVCYRCNMPGQIQCTALAFFVHDPATCVAPGGTLLVTAREMTEGCL